MTLKSPYFDAQHLDQAVLCLAIAEVQHDDIQEIVLPLLCAILQYPYKLVITPTLRVLRGSLCSCRGVTNRQQQQRHLIQFQLEGIRRLRHREKVHPAGPDAKIPGFQHHMSGHDAGILFTRTDAVLKRVDPFLILAHRHHQHDRRVERAASQPRIFSSASALCSTYTR